MGETNEAEAQYETQLGDVIAIAVRLAQGDIALELAQTARNLPPCPFHFLIKYHLLREAQKIAPEGIGESIVIPETLVAAVERQQRLDGESVEYVQAHLERAADQTEQKARTLDRDGNDAGYNEAIGMAVAYRVVAALPELAGIPKWKAGAE